MQAERLYTAAEVAAMIGLSPGRVRHIGSDYGLGVVVGGGVDANGTTRGGRRMFTAADVAVIVGPRVPGWRIGKTGAAAHKNRRRRVDKPVVVADTNNTTHTMEAP
jgi:hypothetical protein